MLAVYLLEKMNLKINKVSFFPVNVFECTIDESYCDSVIELVEKEKLSWGKDLKNVKALTTGWNGLRYSILQDIGNFACSSILPAIGNSQQWQYNNWYTKEAWINFYQKKDYATPHCHYYADFCAVLIVREGQGNLNFCNIIDGFQIKKPFELETHEKIIEKKGSFIFFPSWLYHYVSEVEKDRITVAFNFANEAIES